MRGLKSLVVGFAVGAASLFVTGTVSTFSGLLVPPTTAPAGATGPAPALTAYVANSQGGSVTPIDLATGTPGTPITGGGISGPLDIAITPDGQTAYVSDDGAGAGGDYNQVTPIDLASGTPRSAITVGPSMAFEWGIAITPDGKTAYVVNEGVESVTPIDLATGAAESPISLSGDAYPADIAITPDGTTAYVTISSGSVVPINLATGTPGTPIALGTIGSNGIAISPDGTMAYVANYSSNSVTPITLATGMPGTAITGGGMNGPWNIAVAPDGQTAYVTNEGGNSVTPINLATGTAGTPITGGGLQNPGDIAITPDGQTAYVTNEGGNSVTPINLATGTAGTPITGGGMDEPMGIAIAAAPPAPVVNSVSPASGPTAGGTTVTVTGTNFTGATAVDFGGTAASSVTVVSDTQITATTPAGSPGPADVAVTTPDGTGTDAGAFTYVVPAITSVTFSGGVLAPVITVQGSGFGDQGTLGTPGVPGCQDVHSSGSDYGNNLWFQDWTAPWVAGRGVACIGLTITSYTSNQIVFGLGSDYSFYENMNAGDSYTLELLGTSFSGTVAYYPPSITSISPGVGPFTGGTPVTISGSGFSNATAVDFGTSPASAYHVVSDTVIDATTPPGSLGTATVSVTTPLGTANAPSPFTYQSTGCSPPVITSPGTATATAGSTFTFNVNICSTAVPTITGSGLPGGLVLTNNLDGTATISGTPHATDKGIYAATITAKVTNQAKATQSLQITVDNPGKFTSSAKDVVHTGTAFSYAISTKYAYPTPAITTMSALPDGVNFVDNGNGTATLEGTPDADAGGTYPISISSANGVGSPVIQSFTLIVYQAPVITSPNSDTITAGVAMTPFEVTTTGYPTPPTITATALPTGTLGTGLPLGVHFVNNHNGTATISGTPKATAAGTYNLTIHVTSKAGVTTQTFALTVTP